MTSTATIVQEVGGVVTGWQHAGVETCPGCGFVWASVPAAEVGPRVRAGAERIVGVVSAHPAIVARRPAPDRWSMLEYTGHVRDGLLILRDRFVVGLVEDNPDFKPMYRDHRVDLGLYGDDGAPLVLGELQMAAGLFARTFDRIGPSQLERPIRYAFPVLSDRTLLWMGQHTVHEVEHHGDDIEANVALLG